MNLIIPPPPAEAAPPATRSGAALRALRLIPARVWRGRPGVLAGRTLASAILAEAVLHSGADTAPAAGTLAGVVTWYLLTVRADLAPPPDGPP